MPLLRAGRADFEGTYHAARDLEQRPVGPRPGRIPIMIGAGGPKMLRLAARHADIWSWYVQERSELAEFAPRLAELEAACLEVGRDPASIGRSAGIIVEPTVVTGAAEALAIPLRGSAEEIADGLRAFGAGGFTQIEILLWPRTLAALEAMAPVSSCSTPTDRRGRHAPALSDPDAQLRLSGPAETGRPPPGRDRPDSRRRSSRAGPVPPRPSLRRPTLRPWRAAAIGAGR